MEEDKEIGMMSEEAFQEVISNIEIISNLTLYGRKNIKYYFNKLKKENAQLKADLYSANSIINEQIGIIKNSVSKDKIIEIIKKLDVDIERNRRREINNAKDGTYKMTIIAYDPETIKMVLLKLLEGDE